MLVDFFISERSIVVSALTLVLIIYSTRKEAWITVSHTTQQERIGINDNLMDQFDSNWLFSWASLSGLEQGQPIT
jgi:hypothetical protein